MLKSFALIVALAQAALSAPTSLVARQSQHIVFDTKSLTIEDGNVGAEVSVRLAAAPTSAATIYLDAPGLKLTDCSFKFTPSDWQTPRKVRLIGGGDAKTTSYTLNAQVFAPGSGSHLAKDTVDVTRKANPSAECYSHGDPHYKTFDGRYYDFQGQGVFYLLKTPTLIVQSDQRSCANKVTCNSAIAIQYGSSVISLTAAAGTKDRLALSALTSKTDGITATANSAGNEFRIAISDGSRITVSIYPWNGVYYMDTSITVAGTHMGKTDGLCGSYNNNVGDDVPTPANFAVSNHENIFTTGKGLAISIPVPPTTSTCKIPALGGAAPPSTDGVDPLKPGGFNSVDIPVPATSVVNDFIASALAYAEDSTKVTATTAAIDATLAKSFCESLRSFDSWCAANIDINFIIGACTVDVANTGDRNIVTNAQRTLAATCAAKAATLAEFTADVAAATQLINKSTDIASKIQGAAAAAVGNIQIPTFNAPSFHAPSFQAPTFQAPAFQMPSFQVPAAQGVAWQAPAVKAPVVQAPAVQAPAWAVPQMPAFQMPAQQGVQPAVMPNMGNWNFKY